MKQLFSDHLLERRSEMCNVNVDQKHPFSVGFQNLESNAHSIAERISSTPSFVLHLTSAAMKANRPDVDSHSFTILRTFSKIIEEVGHKFC